MHLLQSRVGVGGRGEPPVELRHPLNIAISLDYKSCVRVTYQIQNPLGIYNHHFPLLMRLHIGTNYPHRPDQAYLVCLIGGRQNAMIVMKV